MFAGAACGTPVLKIWSSYLHFLFAVRSLHSGHPYSLELIVSFWFLGKNPNVNLILGFKASGSGTKYILRLAAC